MFPLGIYAREGRIYLIHGYGNELTVKQGSEILSVNGMKSAEIVSGLTENIWSDGYIMTKRYRRLNRVFPFLFAMNYGFQVHYDMVVSENGAEKEIRMDPLDRRVINSFMDAEYENRTGGRPDLWMDVLDERIALMTIRTFAYYSEVDKFHRFIDSCFQVIREKQISDLIIDLRGNEGGDPFCSTHLLRYLQEKPVIYFAHPYGHYADFNKPLPMVKNHFTGNQYYLIDGMCFSTTGHLTSLLKYHNLGTFIGEETGATFTCNDASHDVILKHTGYRLQSARRSFAAAVSGLPFDRGILPDYPIDPSVVDVIRGRDAALEFTLDLIRGSSSGGE
jgi:hypothetical protein